MTGLALLMLGIGLVLMPSVSQAQLRTESLRAGGRLAPGRSGAQWPEPSRLTSGGRRFTRGWAPAEALTRARLWVRPRDAGVVEAAQIRAVRLMSRELAAGSPPSQAWAAAAQLAGAGRSAFDAASRAAALGADSGAALQAAAAGDEGLRRLGHAWSASAALGGAVSNVLDRWVEDLEARARNRDALAEALAGPRASAMLIAGLPVVGLALGAALGASPLAVLTGSGIGRVVGVIGVAWEAAGLLWVRRIIAAAQRA